MSLEPPVLDDRTFQDIVDETKKQITERLPAWTDHNVSDPGVALIELFAWMTEQTLFRLNQVPDRMYIKFLEMIGVDREPAVSAKATLEFLLSDAAVIEATIPRGTPVGTPGAGGDDAVVFTTYDHVTVRQPVLVSCLSGHPGGEFRDRLEDLRNPRLNLPIFEPLVPDAATYFGFEKSLSNHIIEFNVEAHVSAVGFDPANPAMVWEAAVDRSDAEWLPMHTVDQTAGLNRAGSVRLTVPPRHDARMLDGQSAYWVRVRHQHRGHGEHAGGDYHTSPVIDSATISTVGAASFARHEQWLPAERLGVSNGEPGQVFDLLHRPILSPVGTPDAVELRSGDGVSVVWEQVDSFAGRSSTDQVVHWDLADGKIAFGPAVHSATGHVRTYGAIPPEGSEIWVSGYRIGGGHAGNVGPHQLTLLRTTVPYVSSVTNPEAADNGVELETIEQAKIRGPLSLVSGDRAVTNSDFERLAQEGAQLIARCKSVAGPGPGTVELYAVPDFGKETLHPRLDDLDVSHSLRRRIVDYLDERRMLGTTVEAHPAQYVGCKPCFTVKVGPSADPSVVVANVYATLGREMHLLDRGNERGGWPFGETVLLANLTRIVAAVDGVASVIDAALMYANTETGQADGVACDRIDVGAHQLPLIVAPAIFAIGEEGWDGSHYA